MNKEMNEEDFVVAIRLGSAGIGREVISDLLDLRREKPGDALLQLIDALGLFPRRDVARLLEISDDRAKHIVESLIHSGQLRTLVGPTTGAGRPLMLLVATSERQIDDARLHAGLSFVADTLFLLERMGQITPQRQRSVRQLTTRIKQHGDKPSIHRDPRAIGSLSYFQLCERSPRLALALRLAASCYVMPLASLLDALFPHSSTRQNRERVAKQLLDEKMLASIDGHPGLVKAARRTIQLVAQAGFAAKLKRAPHETMLPGYALAGEFLAALVRKAAHEPRLHFIAWKEQNNSGAGYRPDGSGILYVTSIVTDQARSAVSVFDLRVTRPPAPDERRVDFDLEIDSGFQTSSQIWDKLNNRLRVEPQGDKRITLWVTSGSAERIATLRGLWNEHMRPQLRAYFISVVALRNQVNDARMDILSAKWFNQDGDLVSGFAVLDLVPLAPWER